MKVYEVEYNGNKYAWKKFPKINLITNDAKKILRRELPNYSELGGLRLLKKSDF